MPPAYAHQRATFMRGLLQRIIRIEYRFSLGKQVPTLVASQAYKTVKVPELAFVDKTISVPTLIKVSLCAPATGIQMSPRLFSTSGVSSRCGMIASAPQPLNSARILRFVFLFLVCVFATLKAPKQITTKELVVDKKEVAYDYKARRTRAASPLCVAPLLCELHNLPLGLNFCLFHLAWPIVQVPVLGTATTQILVPTKVSETVDVKVCFAALAMQQPNSERCELPIGEVSRACNPSNSESLPSPHFVDATTLFFLNRCP